MHLLNSKQVLVTNIICNPWTPGDPFVQAILAFYSFSESNPGNDVGNTNQKFFHSKNVITSIPPADPLEYLFNLSCFDDSISSIQQQALSSELITAKECFVFTPSLPRQSAKRKFILPNHPHEIACSNELDSECSSNLLKSDTSDMHQAAYDDCFRPHLSMHDIVLDQACAEQLLVAIAKAMETSKISSNTVVSDNFYAKQAEEIPVTKILLRESERTAASTVCDTIIEFASKDIDCLRILCCACFLQEFNTSIQAMAIDIKHDVRAAQQLLKRKLIKSISLRNQCEQLLHTAWYSKLFE
jgi:hypothetical protein